MLGILSIISLAWTALTYTRSWAADSKFQRVRLAGELKRAKTESALLQEVIRIKDARMERIPPHNRPHYTAAERMAILEMRAAQGWSVAQTAGAFLVDLETIWSWTKRIDEEGPDALVGPSEPVNKFPAFVGYVVKRLKALCPAMGKKRIAQVLACAGLHVAVTTVGRMLKSKSSGRPCASGSETKDSEKQESKTVVTASHPNHVWQVDLTVVATVAGFWIPWAPFTLPQIWPFCWHVAAVVDHFSRKVLGLAVFAKEPTSLEIRSFLGRVIGRTGKVPRHLISDKGSQFWCDGFKKWCQRRGILPRFGAVGQYGSIALIERFIRSLKTECTRRIFVPLRVSAMRNELVSYLEWFNGRPHQGLFGRTPNEAYYRLKPASEALRFEPRARWPIKSPCAGPKARIRGKRGAKFQLVVSFHNGQSHLPLVELRKSA